MLPMYLRFASARCSFKAYLQGLREPKMTAVALQVHGSFMPTFQHNWICRRPAPGPLRSSLAYLKSVDTVISGKIITAESGMAGWRHLPAVQISASNYVPY